MKTAYYLKEIHDFLLQSIAVLQTGLTVLTSDALDDRNRLAFNADHHRPAIIRITGMDLIEGRE